ncbi:TIGR00645 family protein [Sphingomicrobium flavum]|uniref:TIGR00645 family protein n=1 Tax=Sphingomicrobium flavum TaxID=1229164 RepID=UPI0021AD5851|nr:TIGR00645 family protein [Sphingomicrobium flavum]
MSNSQSQFLRKAENALETTLFASRWLMAPFYLLMIGALGMLLVKFAQESWHILTHTLIMTESDAVLAVLSLIDITLTGNLLLMVLFAGYENFVSKLDVDDHEDRPDWMGKVDFAGLKLKLVASIVAISGINLLKNFMALEADALTQGKQDQLFWLLAIHLMFVVSGVMLAFMDKIVASTPRH